MATATFVNYSKAQQRWIKRARAGEPVRYGLICELELWRYFIFVQLTPQKNKNTTKHIAVAEIGVDEIDVDALAEANRRRYTHGNTVAKNSAIKRMLAGVRP